MTLLCQDSSLARSSILHAPPCRREEVAAAPELLLQKLGGGGAGLSLRREQPPGNAGHGQQADQDEGAHKEHHRLGAGGSVPHVSQRNRVALKAALTSRTEHHDRLSSGDADMPPSMAALLGMAASGGRQRTTGMHPLQNVPGGTAGLGPGCRSPAPQPDLERSRSLERQPNSGLRHPGGALAAQPPPWLQQSDSGGQLDLLFTGNQHAPGQPVATCVSLLASPAADRDPVEQLFRGAKRQRPLLAVGGTGSPARCVSGQLAQQQAALAHRLGCGEEDEGVEPQGWRSPQPPHGLGTGAHSHGSPLADGSMGGFRISGRPSLPRCSPQASELGWVEQLWGQAQSQPSSPSAGLAPFLWSP